MFTDIVGYSKKIQKDQALTLAALEDHNKIVQKNIESHQGRVVKFTGDGYMAEFASSTTSVKSAIDIQLALKKRNEIEPENRKITIRIGIHTGDVVRENDDLVGDGVNIASRIEGIAPHGGIAISKTVWQSIKNEKNIYTREVGPIVLKNITDPETIYKVYTSQIQYKEDNHNRLVNDFIQRGIALHEGQSTQEVIRLAVLYFKNMGSEEDNYLCHGLTSDLISEFAKMNEIQTPLLTEMLQFKDSEDSAEEIRKKMKVDYLVEGSLLKSGKKCQISVQLVDLKTSASIWSENFEETVDTIQQISARSVAGVLHAFDIELPLNVKALIGKKQTDDPVAYEFYLKGMYYFEKSGSRMEMEMARDFFKKAFEKDEAFIEARWQHALTYKKDGKLDIAADYLEESLLIAQDLKDERGIAGIYNCFGLLYLQWGKFQRSIGYFEKALKIETKYHFKANEAKARHNMSMCYINLQQTDKALNELNRSLEIKQELKDHSGVARTTSQIAQIYEGRGEYHKAFDTSSEALKIFEEEDLFQSVSRVLLDIALYHSYFNDFDSARESLYRSIKIAEGLNDTLALGKAYETLGDVSLEDEDWNDAIDQFGKALEYYQLAEFKVGIEETNFQLGISQKNAKNYVEARRILQHTLSLNERSNDDFEASLTKTHLFQIDCKEEKLNEKELELFINDSKVSDLLSLDDHEGYAILSWELSRLYALQSNTKQEDKYHKLSKQILQKRASMIKDDKERKSFLSSRRIFRNIL